MPKEQTTMAQAVAHPRTARTHAFLTANDIIDTYGPQIGALGVAMYAVVQRDADRTTGECWPSIATIAN